MRRFIQLLACLLFLSINQRVSHVDAASSTLPAELVPYASALRPGFERDLIAMADAPRYDIDLSIDPERRVITGTQRVRYVNREAAPLDELVLRLYPNTSYMSGGMVISDVIVDGRPVRVEPYRPDLFADSSAMRVSLATPLKPKQVLELRASYLITAPLKSKTGYTTFGMIDGIFALPDAYAMVAARDNGHWLADPAPGFGDIVQSEMALYRVTLHAPKDYVVVASGVCEPPPAPKGVKVAPAPIPSPLGRGEGTLTCVAAPARDFAAHLSHFYRELTSIAPDALGNDVVVHSYFTALHQRAGENALLYAAEALRTYERRFGPYPYRELKVFESPSIAGGIEYPISVGVNYSLYQQDGGYTEWVMAHEVAHQWWYGMVGSDPIREAWLDEAMAQFSASLYIEDRYGTVFADAERQRFFIDRYVAETKERGDTRAAQPTSAFYRWTYAPIVYGKAPLFFQDVRDAAGDARFELWWRRYFQQHRLGFAHAPDLLRAADEIGLGNIVRDAYTRRILSR